MQVEPWIGDLVEQTSGKLEERPDVGKIRHHADRNSDGTRALAIDTVTEILVSHSAPRSGEAGHDLVFGEAKGHLARTGIAETAGA